MNIKSLLFVAVIAIAMLFSTVDGNAQKAAKRFHQSIGANPLGLAFGMLNATYEQQLKAKNSFTISGYYWSFLDWSAYGIGGSYRWYLFDKDTGKQPLEGFSAGPLVSFSTWSYDGAFNSTFDGGINVAIGGEAGYKWVFGSGFMVEPIIQVSFGIISITGLDYQPFGAGVNLGYAW